MKHFAFDANLDWTENDQLSPFPFELAAILEEEDRKRKESSQNLPSENQPIRTYGKQTTQPSAFQPIFPSFPPISTSGIDYEGKN